MASGRRAGDGGDRRRCCCQRLCRRGCRFSISHPERGPYAVKVRAAGFNDASTQAADGDQVTLSATPAADPLRLAPSSDFLALLPDGDDKRRFLSPQLHQLP